MRYAATGSVVGPGIAPTRLAMLYVDDASAAATTLDLVPADAGANVFLIEPFDDVVFDRTRPVRVAGATGETFMTTTALPQTVADLLTSPGRGPNEAEALVQQMKERLDDWRLTLWSRLRRSLSSAEVVPILSGMVYATPSHPETL
jgi:hypothetical protein